MTTNELTKIWAKISGLFARKTEVATKADKAVVVTLSPDVNQQIVADKTFDEVFALLQGGTEVMFNNNNGFYFKVVVFTDAAILASVTDQAITSSIYWSKTAGITITETQLQQLLTFDNEPRKASTNPVTSAGLHEALQSKADTSTTYTKTEVNTALQGKADVTTLVEVTATGDVTQALGSGKFYRFGEVDSLTLTFTAPSAGLGMWGGKFTASANWSALGIPATIDEAAGNDTIAGGKTYEFNVLDNIIVVKEV